MSESEPTSLSHRSKLVHLDQLLLDPNNYRLRDQEGYTEVAEDKIADELVQRRTRQFLHGERQTEVLTLIDSLKANGWQPVDNIQVRPYPGKTRSGRERFVVVEGNRRVATLQFLSAEYEQRAADLGRFDKELFKRLPVWLYDGEGADELHYMVLMGLKHISGNKRWPAINQARFLKRLVELGNEPSEVCARIGITKQELNRSINTLALCELYQQSEYGDQFRSSQYNIFREVMGKPRLRAWLGWDYNRPSANTQTQNLSRLFSWLSKEETGPRIADEGEEEQSSGVVLSPALTTGDEIRKLAEIIEDEAALRVLDRTRSLIDANLASQKLVKDKVVNAAEILRSQINVLFSYNEHISEEQRRNLEGARARLDALLSLSPQGSLLGRRGSEIPAYNDLPQQHFLGVTVHQHRAHRDLVVGDLRRINVFGGLNNSGKTSLLEAVYLLSQQSRFDAVVELLLCRAHERSLPGGRIWDTIPRSAHISGRFDRRDDNLAELHVQARREDSPDLDLNGYLGSVELSARYSKDEQRSISHIYADQRPHTSGQIRRVLAPAMFSTPFMLHDSEVLSRLWDESLRARTKEKLMGFLTDALSWRTLRQIDRAGDPPRFIINDDNFDEGVELSVYGEGLQRMFHIGLLFAGAKNGIVLIDELENAIHASLLKPFAGFIAELARELNVQVFLTTHSRECIQAFVEPELAEDVAYYALQREGERTRCERLDGERLAELFTLMDIEPRSLS